MSRERTAWTSFILALAGSDAAWPASERLLGSGGVTELEGSGGGGLTPWALIAGLETNSEWGGSADCTYIRPRYFTLKGCSAALGVHDRLELSYARQSFDLGDVAPGRSIRLQTFGAKLRLLGDAVFDQDGPWPQLALGVQYKRNDDFDFIPRLAGARTASGTDFYLAATRLFLAGPLSHTWLLNVTLRASRADQFGLLGFGGDRQNDYRLLAEASAVAFVTDNVLAGAEYRQKPDNLRAFREGAAHDIFVSWFPVKHLALTVAYVSLGNIATHPGEDAGYLALQAVF